MLCIHKFRWPNTNSLSYDRAVTGQDEEIQVPVLIVGGSLVGLSTALLLARYGIESLVVERHSGTAIHPRAGHFNLRTLEMKLAIEVTGSENSATREGKCYRVYSRKAIVERRKRAGLEWVRRTRGVELLTAPADCLDTAET